MTRLEPSWKFLIDAVEASIREEGDHVARSEFWCDALDDFCSIGMQFCGCSSCVQCIDDVFRMEPLCIRDSLLLIDTGENDVIGQAQAVDEIVFEHLAPQCIRACLQYGPETLVGINGTERAQCFANRRWVMCEIINDGDAANDIANLKAALDAFETGHRCADGFLAEALTYSKSSRCGCVQRVVLARELHGKLRPQLAVVPYFPSRQSVGMTQIANLPSGFRIESITFYTAKGVTDTLSHVVAAFKGNKQAATWHKIYQAFERHLHRFEIGIDVRMIKIDMREDHRIREVVQELWPLVEEGCVVFISLDDESVRWPKLEAGAEVLSHSANQERRLKCRIIVRRNLVDP